MPKSGGHFSYGRFDAPQVYVPVQYDYDEDDREELPDRIPFYGWVRGVARLTLVGGGSLSLAYLTRLFPVLLPAYLVLLFAAIAATLIGVLFTRNQALCLVLFSVLAVGTGAGCWDAIYAVFQTPYQGAWLYQLATIVVIAIFAVIVERVIKLSRREEY